VTVEFHNLIGDSFNFSDGQVLSYKIDICKQKNKIIIGVDGWNKYISNNKLTGGEYIGFYLKKVVNKLRIKYFSDQDDELDEDDDEAIPRMMRMMRVRMMMMLARIVMISMSMRMRKMMRVEEMMTMMIHTIMQFSLKE
jgi:hypothetical protein